MQRVSWAAVISAVLTVISLSLSVTANVLDENQLFWLAIVCSICAVAWAMLALKDR